MQFIKDVNICTESNVKKAVEKFAQIINKKILVTKDFPAQFRVKVNEKGEVADINLPNARVREILNNLNI